MVAGLPAPQQVFPTRGSLSTFEFFFVFRFLLHTDSPPLYYPRFKYISIVGTVVLSGGVIGFLPPLGCFFGSLPLQDSGFQNFSHKVQ